MFGDQQAEIVSAPSPSPRHNHEDGRPIGPIALFRAYGARLPLLVSCSRAGRHLRAWPCHSAAPDLYASHHPYGRWLSGALRSCPSPDAPLSSCHASPYLLRPLALSLMEQEPWLPVGLSRLESIAALGPRHLYSAYNQAATVNGATALTLQIHPDLTVESRKCLFFQEN